MDPRLARCVQSSHLYMLLSFSISFWHRKPLVVTKHSGLDESGDSNASEDVDMYNAYGELDMTRLPKGDLTWELA